jgi:hypothetical protein
LLPPTHDLLAVDGLRDIANLSVRGISTERMQPPEEDLKFLIADAPLLAFSRELQQRLA